MPRHAVLTATLAAALALSLTAGATAVGPTMPTTDGPITSATDVSYVTKVHGATTTLTARDEGGVRNLTLKGGWGVQMVTLDGSVGGLSPNGRILVLSQMTGPTGLLRASSKFDVIDTRSLSLTRTVSLRGDYGIDALSPTGHWFYLIHHKATPGNPTQPIAGNRYQVQAYDLRAGRLLRGVIADKTQAGWLMAGYPVTRATSAGGDWVYTLYQSGDNYPFVHALDTVHRTAICVGLPWLWNDQAGIGTASLTLKGGKLMIEGGGSGPRHRFALDTGTFRVSTLKTL